MVQVRISNRTNTRELKSMYTIKMEIRDQNGDKRFLRQGCVSNKDVITINTMNTETVQNDFMLTTIEGSEFEGSSKMVCNMLLSDRHVCRPVRNGGGGERGAGVHSSWANYFKIMQFFTRNWVFTPNFGLKIKSFLRFAPPPPTL